MQLAGANDLASKNHCMPDVKTANPPEEREDSSHLDMKVRCLCGSSLITESMIQVIMLASSVRVIVTWLPSVYAAKNL